jgi:hypothetical protein
LGSNHLSSPSSSPAPSPQHVAASRTSNASSKYKLESFGAYVYQPPQQQPFQNNFDGNDSSYTIDDNYSNNFYSSRNLFGDNS